MLFTGSGDELCADSSLSLTHCQPFCLSSHCLLKVRVEISSLLLPPSLVQQLITCPLSAHLPLQSLFIDSLCIDQLFALSPSPVLSEHPAPSAECSFSVPCLLFSFWFFLLGGGQSILGAMLVYPRVAVGILCAAYLLICLSASSKQVWSQCLAVWETSCFLSVTWCVLGIQGVGVLILFSGFFFLPSAALASQRNF
jgi:hypothetical protein